MHSAVARLKRAVPWSLLSVRVVLVPVFIIASSHLSDHLILWLYLIAFITDYFDGASARFFGTATPSLRRADSTADTVFHLALAWVILQHHPEVFLRCRMPLIAFLATALGWYILDAIRWHRVAGYHARSAKLFSIGLMIWMVLFLCHAPTGLLLPAVLIFGAISNVEGIFISLLLTQYRCDVPSVFHLLVRGRETRQLAKLLYNR